MQKDDMERCPKCEGPMDNGIHKSPFSPCIIGDGDDIEAQQDGWRL